MRFLLWVLVAFLSASVARAERPSATGPHYVFAASWVHRDDESSVEGQFTALIPPIADRAFELGPRLGVLRTLSGYDMRTDFSVGGEALVWIVNLIGPGVAADWVVTSKDTGTHARIEPFASLRLAHVLTEGALALRVGMPYETTKAWGFRLGLTLQLDGVP